MATKSIEEIRSHSPSPSGLGLGQCIGNPVRYLSFLLSELQLTEVNSPHWPWAPSPLRFSLCPCP
jgi:hypothetical protein